MRGEDEHKDEIKPSGSEEEEKGPKQRQGEGEPRYCILMLKFREGTVTDEWSLQCLTVQSQPSLTRHFQIKKWAMTRQSTSLS